MGRLARLIGAEFREWAIDQIAGIFTQYIGVTMLELANHGGAFAGTFAMWHMPVFSQILDGLWWLDTAYSLASVFYNMFSKPRRGKPNY